MSCKDDHSLLQLVVRQRWAAVKRRLGSCPYELNDEMDDCSVLHWACYNDAPTDVLRAMLEYDCLQPNPTHSNYDAEGKTPIMCTLLCGPDVETIALFCELAPASILVRSQEEGLTCLHYFCEFASFTTNVSEAVDGAKLLLEADPTQATTLGNKTHFSRISPLDELWGWWSHATPATCETIIEVTRTILDTVVPEKDGGTLLHQLLCFPCPLPVGAVRQISRTVQLDRLDNFGNSVVHRAIRNNQDAGIVVQLLHQNQGLVRQRNHDGKVPIQVAEGWSLAHDQLLFYDPGLVDAIELPESIYPTLLSQLRSVNTLFQIIKARPTLMQR